MQMDEGMDTGDVLLEEKISIGDMDTTPVIWERLSKLSAKLTVQALERIDVLKPVKQDHTIATYAPLLEKGLGQMNWAWSAQRLHNLVRGTQPWPGAHTSFRGDLLKIWETEPCNGSGPPGVVIEADRFPVVATGNGALRLLSIQRAGKKRMSADTLIHGQRLAVGEKLGPQE
jgi:methionyl-tRNA formyltransferase